MAQLFCLNVYKFEKLNYPALFTCLNVLFFPGVRKYGKDFQAMAEVLGNKNINQCHNFFVNYRRRFNLIDVLYEYEKENNIPRSDPMSTPMELWDENMTQSPTSATSSKEEPKDNSTNNNIPRSK